MFLSNRSITINPADAAIDMIKFKKKQIDFNGLKLIQEQLSLSAKQTLQFIIWFSTCFNWSIFLSLIKDSLGANK